MTDKSKRLERSRENRMIAGVAAGVADFFGLDPTLVRVLWAITVLFGGFGIVVYVIMWIVVPEAGSETTIAHDIRDSTSPTESEPPVDEPAEDE